MAAPEAKAPLYVLAPLVQVLVQGNAAKNLRNGDLVTDDVLPSSVEHLKSLGFIGEQRPLDPK